MHKARDKNAQAVIDEAAEWVVRVTAADVSHEDKREFIAWLKRSPVHLGEYLRMERTWADLGTVDAAHRVDLAELLAGDDSNVVELGIAGNIAERPDSGASSRARPRVRGMVAALAASVLLALVGAFWFHTQFANRFTTGVGEQRTVKLDDGSTVVLNTQTALRVNFTAARREVQLLEGEALFNVAKDAARPFRVLSDRAIAQAVGTSFIVRLKEHQTEVTVIEGQVAVARAAHEDDFGSTQAPQQSVRLSAGGRADVADRAISTATVVNPSAVTAWRSGRLIFDGETLAEAVAEFNRYNDVQIVLKDSQLSNERLSGVFDANQPQALAHFLERSGVIEPVQTSGRDIILVPQR